MCYKPLADPGDATSARPPNRINFFRFCICFHQKVYASEVGTPQRVGAPPPPNGKSWIRHCKPYLNVSAPTRKNPESTGVSATRFAKKRSNRWKLASPTLEEESSRNTTSASPAHARIGKM